MSLGKQVQEGTSTIDSSKGISKWISFIFIYFHSKVEVPKDVIEDAIEEVLQGKGERGTGNLDIEVYDTNEIEVKDLVINTLKKLKVPRDTIIDVNGHRTNLYGLMNLFKCCIFGNLRTDERTDLRTNLMKHSRVFQEVC
ncbi:hypothetical protein [Paenibacillus sp. GXUN7292]|uniref:hypothetical protein n=1 Tax=Paenibacillus sp. GXUN7292 TaxID=3422499 RepID=UPI003D7D1E1A